MSAGYSRLRHLIDRLRGQPLEFRLRRYETLLAHINHRESALQPLTDDELKSLSAALRDKARGGARLGDLAVEAFALARETARRVLGLRPFDVQIIAGLALLDDKVVEMQTGEGKTLAAVAPAYLQALGGCGVHVLTFNDYLARRDAQWMGPIYRFLGLTVGHVQQGLSIAERQRAYAADVTYGTAKEVGFDYLRDQLATRPEDLTQRAFHYAIVDEADSILIDEARIPLVIAGSAADAPADPARVTALVRELAAGADYDVDENGRNVFLTKAGTARVEKALGCGNLFDEANQALLTSVNLALHAQALLRRDVDYIVRGERVELVDEFTGRIAENRRWPDGLQTMLEAKEGLGLQQEGVILGSITLQHFAGLYPQLAGMTATAQAAADEFKEFYRLNTVVVPPNVPCVRLDQDDLVFTHREAKEQALTDEIRRVHTTGQPVLVGTSSVEESERLAAALHAGGIACQVLNAKNDEQEAAIVAQAGSFGAVTISTNMAGRGTDIRLGTHSADERARVVALGGLYVIGTNRHDSRRVDDQLRGRAGRQGDPGASRFFVSLDDELMVRFGLADLMPKKYRGQRLDQPLPGADGGREIAQAQRIIEGQNLSIRKTLAKYASLVEMQRKLLRAKRDEVLRGDDVGFLAQSDPERYEELRAAVGEQELARVEKQLTLLVLDQCWSDHLTHVADLREGIHLLSLHGSQILFGQRPLDEFHRAVTKAFGELTARIEAEIVTAFQRVRVVDGRVDLHETGFKGPSATWTYLINDNPLGNEFARFFQGMKKKLFEKKADSATEDD